MKNRLIAGLSAAMFAAAIFSGTADAAPKFKINLSTEQVKHKKHSRGRKAQVKEATTERVVAPDQGHGAALRGADLVCAAHCQG